MTLGPPLMIALLFLAPSTRSRLGFAVAAKRLGGQSFQISEIRETGPGLPGETIEDTVRVCSGMCDVVVLRSDEVIDWGSLSSKSTSPLVNAGDGSDHPTQALIDRFAMEVLKGSVRDLHIAISGDLTMRASRSLLHLLAVDPPAKLSLYCPPNREPLPSDLPSRLSAVTTLKAQADFRGADVVYLPGLTPGSGPGRLNQSDRDRWGFTPATVSTVGVDAIVLSPGPVIDEIHPSCRADPRIKMFEQSDLGVFVRMGVLRLLGDRSHGD